MTEQLPCCQRLQAIIDDGYLDIDYEFWGNYKIVANLADKKLKRFHTLPFNYCPFCGKDRQWPMSKFLH